MRKQVVLDQLVLEFRGKAGLLDQIADQFEARLRRTDWNELLKPVLRGLPTKIRVIDVSGRPRTAKRKAIARKGQTKGTFCVEITRIGYGSRRFEISHTTEEEAQRSALRQAVNHEFSEKHSEYEIESVSRKPS